MPQPPDHDNLMDPDEEPLGWTEPVPCPACDSTETRLMIEIPSDVPIYECERCRTRFETRGG
jgi:hypothetical protein